MSRAFLAALTLCVVMWVLMSGAEAHSLHRYHQRVVHHHSTPDASQMLGQGLIHMLRSMPKHRVAHRHYRHRVAVARSAPPADAVFLPFEQQPMADLFGAGQLAAREVYRGAGVGLVTIQTAAGIPIRVASDFAPKIEGFIRDIVAMGYRPGKIHCYARGGHVSHSLHYSGHACDFDQHGWGKTASTMYRVAALASRWGLRDGCTFRDCGHIDAGFAPRFRRSRYASAR